jgi:hypothetical protein
MSLNLSIKNFQSIKETNLDLSGFTVITGSSNLGKSAVRRAFATVLYNDWDASYVRDGFDGAEIELERDGNIVKVEKEYRKDTIKKNTFTVNGKSYDKMGRSNENLPDEYAEFGWQPLKAQGDKYKLNIATQLEPLFMIGNSDTENTAILNNAFKMDAFERASAEAGRDAKEIDRTIKVHGKDLSAKEEELRVVQRYLDRLESIKEIIEKLSTDYELIEQYIGLKRAYNEQKPEYERLLLESKLIDLTQKIITIKNYLDKVEELKRVENEIEIVGKVAKLLPMIELAKRYVEKTNEVREKEKRETLTLNAKEKIDQLGEILSLVELKTKMDKAQESIEKNQEELREIDKEIHSLGVCPLCQREL